MDFDFTDSGSGPALLFLPGSYSTHAAWRGIQKALNGSYRLISISLPGYGETPEIRDDSVIGLDQMTDFVADVVTRVGEPVHLIGHSWGGLVSFATVLSGKVSPLSLITFEGNPIYAQSNGEAFLWLEEVLQTTKRFEEAVAAGEPEAAAIIIDFWGGTGVFAKMPDPFRDYCRSTVFTNVLDWRSAAGFTPNLSEFADINVLSTVVRGEFANQAIVDISDRVTQEIPDSALRIVDQASHFLINTHPADCAAIIDAHMTRFNPTSD